LGCWDAVDVEEDQQISTGVDRRPRSLVAGPRQWQAVVHRRSDQRILCGEPRDRLIAHDDNHAMSNRMLAASQTLLL
jgi:hypothetical protein